MDPFEKRGKMVIKEDIKAILKLLFKFGTKCYFVP
jgi:hypothetical protein